MGKSPKAKGKLSVKKEVVRKLLGRDLTSVRGGKGVNDWLACDTAPRGPDWPDPDTGGDTCSCDPCANERD